MSEQSINKVVPAEYRLEVANANAHIEKFKHNSYRIANSSVFSIITDINTQISPSYDPNVHYDCTNARLTIIEKIMMYFKKYSIELVRPLAPTIESELDKMLDVKLDYKLGMQLDEMEKYYALMPRSEGQTTGSNQTKLVFYKPLYHVENQLLDLNSLVEKKAKEYDGSAYNNSWYKYWYNFSWCFRGWWDGDYEYTKVAGYYRLFKNTAISPLLTNVKDLISALDNNYTEISDSKKNHNKFSRIIEEGINDCLRIELKPNSSQAKIYNINIGNISRFTLENIRNKTEKTINEEFKNKKNPTQFEVKCLYCNHHHLTENCLVCEEKSYLNIMHNCYVFLSGTEFSIITDKSTIRGLFMFEPGIDYQSTYHEPLKKYYVFSPVEIDICEYKNTRMDSKIKKLRNSLTKIKDTFKSQ